MGSVLDQDSKITPPGGSNIRSGAQGHAYTVSDSGGSIQNGTYHNSSFVLTKSRIQGGSFPLPKPAAVFERSKPQYEDVQRSSFISVKSRGAKGDGITDDTAAIQAIFDASTPGQVVYFDHGAYIISETVRVHMLTRIAGENSPRIVASGTAFSDPLKPAPVFQIGQPGDVGSVELSDLIFETKGSQPGAILMEWNLNDPVDQQSPSAMWDVHFRVGGTPGTEIQPNTCLKPENGVNTLDKKSDGAFSLLDVTSHASIYIENSGFRTANDELDLEGHKQGNFRVESIKNQGPVWTSGTSWEHSQLRNHHITHTSDVYTKFTQSETPYALDLSCPRNTHS